MEGVHEKIVISSVKFALKVTTVETVTIKENINLQKCKIIKKILTNYIN